MSSSPDPPAALVGQYGLPAGLSAEEAGLYVDGLTQTCAALRRRIAELESENRALHHRTSNLDAAAGESSGGYAGGLFGGADSTLSPKDMMVLMSPPGVAAERIGGGGGGGVSRSKDGCSKSGGGPRARLSWMAGRPGRGSTAPSESEAGGFTIVAAQGFDDSATRRVSAIPSRARYSVGPSRFSLPPNMSPGPPNAACADGTNNDPENGPEISPRHRWEGLTLTHPLTGDEKNLTFMEFAVVGVSLSTLAGTQPLEPWGQAPEVLSGFPVTEGNDTSGRGKGDGSFVQGLGEFCFPCGANIALVRGRGGTGTREAVPEDRMHLLQFTDCDNASTYGCCLTVTHVLQDPPPRLVLRLQERERMHQAARTLQRFFTLSAACLSTGKGHHWRGDSTGYGCATPTRTPREEGGSFSRFGFQTPPPRAATGAGSAASEQGNSPASSFSGMINRFFSNPGVVADGGSGVAAAAGGLSVGAAAADAETASSGVAAVGAAVADGGDTGPGGDGDSSPPRSVREEGTSPRKKRSVTAVAVSPSRPSPPPSPPPPPAALSPSRLMQRAPSSPCPRTSPSGEYCHHPTGMSGRSRSAGHGGGGGGNVAGRERSEGTVKKNVPGMFSDDESESDAGYSSTDGGDSLAGGSFEAASVSGSQAANGTRRGGQSGGVRGYAKGSCPEMPGAERSSETPMTPIMPPGVTLRNRTVNPRTVAAAVAVIGGATKGREASAGRERLSWSVQVEKCYVMVSSHRNHPLMFKVLKAIADAERSARRGPHPPSSSLSPPAHHTAAGGRRRAVIASLSPPRVRSGGVVGVNTSGGGKEKSPSASRFRSVAAAAAEQAKERHRRMVRDKFLQQVRTDKSCIEEGKKVSLYCPAFLRAPLELTPPSLELWSTAVLFGCVSERAILRALDVLLLEKTLVVCGRDIGIVSMAATALLSLLDPFKWEGVFVPVVPVALMDVLESPVPALVGVQAPLDPLSYAADGVAVLDLDANNASGELFMAGAHEDSTVPEHLVTSLEHANTLRGRRRSSGAPAGRRSPARKLDATAGGKSPRHKKSSTHDRVATSTGGSGSGTRGVSPRGMRGGAPLSGLRSSSSSSLLSSSPGPRSHLVFQATTFMAGLTLEEKGVVLRLRSLVKAHVSRLCGDLVASDMWRKYGAFNSVTDNFDFHPDWFTEPLEAQLRFQVAVSRTQMFVSFVERCRQKDISEVGDEVEGQEQVTPEKREPYAEPSTGERRGSRGSIPTH